MRPRLRWLAHRLRPSAPVPVDALIALALLVGIELQVLLGGGHPAAAIAGLGFAAAVAIRRRRPLEAIGLAAAAAIGQDLAGAALSGATPLALVAVILVLYAAAAGLPRRRAWPALGLGLLSAGAAGFFGEEAAASALFGAILFVLVPWCVGRIVREGRERESAERARAEHLDADRERHSVAAGGRERVRIARELHDVITHSLSVMVIQAGAARAVMSTEPERAKGSLRLAARAGTEALAETERLLGLLGEDEERSPPGPGLADLGTLLDQARAGGLAVDLAVEGEPVPLAPALDLCAYRILQEALTNTIRHACADSAAVRLRWSAAGLELEVHDDGRGPAAGEQAEGHGILGMRERAWRLGGEVTAGADPRGGFRVRAVLPLPAIEREQAPRRRRRLGLGRPQRISLDALATAAIAVALQLEVWLTTGSRPLAAIAALAFAAAVALRRRQPGLALVLAATVLSTQALLGGGLGGGSGVPVLLGLALLAYAVGARLPPGRGLASLLLAACAFAGFAATASAGLAATLVAELFVAVVALLAPWFAGRLVAGHQRRADAFAELAARAADDRREGAQEAVAAERARIARELEDLVAAGVRKMIALARTAREALAADPDRARAAILALEGHGRETLADLRRLLGVLHGGEEPEALAPQPGLGELPALLAASATTGLSCHLQQEGDRVELAPALDLVAYRAVQGGLALAEGRRSDQALVTIRWQAALLELEVRGEGANGEGDGDGELGSLGRRLALYGGTIEEVARPGGDFSLRVRLPIGERVTA